jgi:hypothetical protein
VCVGPIGGLTDTHAHRGPSLPTWRDVKRLAAHTDAAGLACVCVFCWWESVVGEGVCVLHHAASKHALWLP